MGVSGLAEGFLAGFNTMDRYQRGQKENELMDKSMSLRDAQWQNEQDRQKVADQRYQENVDYAKERDSLGDARYEKEFALNERQAKSAEARANAAERRTSAGEARQQQEYQWQTEQRDKQLFQQENMPIFQSGWQQLRDGKDPGEQFWAAAKDERAGLFNPNRWVEPGSIDKSTYVVKHTGNLMNLLKDGKLDPRTPEGNALINDAKYLEGMDYLYRDEVRKGVGDIDPASGKTITDKKLANMMITPDGRGLVLGVEVTYNDGSKDVRPVTNNRTSAPGDHPKVIPINDFLKPAFQRAALVKEISPRAGDISSWTGLTAGPDLAGYKRALTDLEKLHGQNRARISASNAEDKDIQLEALDAQLESSKAAAADTHGMTSKREEPAAGAPIKEWTGGDPDRLQFIKEANQHGKLNGLLENPTRMNTAFEMWRQQATKKKQAEQATVTANRLRDTETNAYQAMSLSQARQ
ncbi:MAG: hypothetical protein ACRC7D_21065 [Aeromonas popoffii]|uniref:hypothetical protein n=1 Tax=Aeromonas popoffii TaxID=70856 RepID=UPI003F32B223